MTNMTKCVSFLQSIIQLEGGVMLADVFTALVRCSSLVFCQRQQMCPPASKWKQTEKEAASRPFTLCKKQQKQVKLGFMIKSK